MKSSNKNFINTLSYVSLIIVALLILINNILPIIGLEIGGTIINVLETVKNLFILIVIGTSAYNFLPGKAKWVKVLFWVSVIVFIAGSVLLWFI